MYGEDIVNKLKLAYSRGGDKEVLRELNNIGCDVPLSLEDIGRVFGITRERVRQIQGVAMKKLKHPRIGMKLKQYYEEDSIDDSTLNYGRGI